MLPMLLVNCKSEKNTQIILISIDTLRSDHLTAYGYHRDTSPNLSKLIDDSTFYKSAYTNGCWTMPSHVSLLTGTLPSRHGINKDWHSTHNKKYPKLNDSIKTISEVLKIHNKNIKTIKFAALPDEMGFKRGFDINNRKDPFDNDNKFNKLLAELENHKKGDFFFFIHTWWVHTPYTHSYFLEKEGLSPEKRKAIDNFKRMSKKQRSALLGKAAKKLDADFIYFLKKNNLFNAEDCRAMYDGGIRYVDAYIGRLLDKLKQLGIYDNVMVVVVSDHGEHFAEHMPKKFYGFHGNDYYEEFIEVPIIIKFPHSTKSKTITYPVSLIDVFPTMLEYYKIKVPGFNQGDSLLIPPSKRKNRYIVSEAITNKGIEKKMIRLGNLKYIITMKKTDNRARVNWEKIKERRLYNLKTDPLEKINLYDTPEYKETCANLEKLLKRILDQSSDPDFSPKETTIEEKTLEQMKALGYL
jgi:arylsulfatase A-like enzyme